MSIFKSYQLLRDYRKDPLSYFIYLYRKNGHRTDLQVLGKRIMLLSHPEDVLHVLKENNAAYTKGRTTKAIKEFLGEGLITSEGESWRKQHRLVRPVMNPKNVYELAPKMHFTAQEFLKDLPEGIQHNSFQAMNLLTWRIVLNTLFSQPATPDLDAWLNDVLFLMDSVTHRTRSLVKLPYWFPIKRHRRVKRAVKKFETFIYNLIDQRQNSEPVNDLLQILIEIKDEEDADARLSKQKIKDEILTFLMAGHETITNTMSWALITLAKNKQYLPKLREEADAFIKTGDVKKLNASPWHTAVVDETMRLWPPVWAFMRFAEKEDEVKGMKIPAKTNVVVSPYLSHRAPDLWERAGDFWPERFIETKIKPGTYYPYGLGPRACIGAYFAGMEAKIILANLVHLWDWDIYLPSEQEVEAGITLRPTNNINMVFNRRKK